MDVQFARDVFAVRENRVDGKEKFGCNFLVGQSFDDVSNDFPFPFGEGIGFVCPLAILAIFLHQLGVF